MATTQKSKPFVVPIEALLAAQGLQRLSPDCPYARLDGLNQFTRSPWQTVLDSGRPRRSASRSSVAATREPDNEVSSSMARPSCVQSFRLSNVVSLTP